MKNLIKFKSFSGFVEVDISKWKEDEFDKKICLNVNKKNWDLLKETLTDKKLMKIVKQNPCWLEFI